MNWRSQQTDSQPLKLAHLPKNPFCAETAIPAVCSPEKGSAVGASVSSTLRSARLGAQSGDPNPFMQPPVAQIERENEAPVGTIKSFNRPGWSASLIANKRTDQLELNFDGGS